MRGRRPPLAALLVGVPAAIAGMLAVVWSLLPKDVSYHARNAAQDYADGNVDALYGRVFEYERQDGLTRARFRGIYDALVRPRLAPFGTRGAIRISARTTAKPTVARTGPMRGDTASPSNCTPS